jgi:hypothetical protein
MRKNIFLISLVFSVFASGTLFPMVFGPGGRCGLFNVITVSGLNGFSGLEELYISFSHDDAARFPDSLVSFPKNLKVLKIDMRSAPKSLVESAQKIIIKDLGLVSNLNKLEIKGATKYLTPKNFREVAKKYGFKLTEITVGWNYHLIFEKTKPIDVMPQEKPYKM